MCGGQGECECGLCQCEPGWAGDACSCSASPSPCVSPYDGEVCSGNGECRCGGCVCDTVPGSGQQWAGQFCHLVPGEGVCHELEACVHCQAFDARPDHCKDCNFNLDYLENDFIEESTHQFEPESPCVAKTSFECNYKYSGNTISNENIRSSPKT